MEENNSLCYFRIENAKNRIDGNLKENITEKDFMFNNKYVIEYKDKTLFISKNKNYIKNFFSIEDSNTNIINISSIVGKNGSGKTALLAIFNEFIYNTIYIDMDVIIVFIIDNKFKIITSEELIENVIINDVEKDYELIKYKYNPNSYFDIKWKDIYKKITTIYFTNTVGIRNNLFSSTKESNNLFNASLNNDLQMNFKYNGVIMNSYWINNKYIDDRFDNNYLKIIVNHRNKKNLKFIISNDDSNMFDISNIEMKLNIYNNQKNFLEAPLSDKMRIYDKFDETKNNEEGRILIPLTITERKIYELLTEEYKQKMNENNKKEMVKNTINLAIIDKYFNELYTKLNNYNIIKFINEKIENQIGNNFNDYIKAFKSIQKLVEEISLKELKDIYIYISDVENKEELANMASKECIEFIKDINKRYDTFFKEIEKIINNSNIEIETINTHYSSENRPYYNYEPLIIIKKEAYKNLYDSILKSNELMELFYVVYRGLSTGEQALLDMYSEFYDIKEKIKTDSIIVLMDEPELYFHPEWQRKLIYLLIEYFNKYFNDKKIQIIFTSNSPYTLSDLTQDNVIMLGNNNNELIDTFANNIHTLLKEKYFMDFTIGELAKIKIEKILEDINNKIEDSNRINEINKIVNMIGEELLKNKIKDMLGDINDQNKRTK